MFPEYYLFETEVFNLGKREVLSEGAIYPSVWDGINGPALFLLSDCFDPA